MSQTNQSPPVIDPPILRHSLTPHARREGYQAFPSELQASPGTIHHWVDATEPVQETLRFYQQKLVGFLQISHPILRIHGKSGWIPQLAQGTLEILRDARFKG
jgi:hypothetical protein